MQICSVGEYAKNDLLGEYAISFLGEYAKNDPEGSMQMTVACK